MQINWFKLNNSAKLPTKRAEDAGFDIYTTEDNVLLMPHQKHQFSTGLAVAPEKGWWMFGCDRGSTGSRGIHTHCGIIDNGYRGEIFICLCNDNDYPVKFTNQIDKIYITTDFYFDENYKQVSLFDITPSPCRNCSNHPSNGGSGNCNCTLGDQVFF